MKNTFVIAVIAVAIAAVLFLVWPSKGNNGTIQDSGSSQDSQDVAGTDDTSGSDESLLPEGELSEFVRCLANAGVVVYGSKTCPACFALVETLGGYDVAAPVYVECAENPQRCEAEMRTNYVPEIQIKGAAFDGPRTLEGLSEATGCKLNN